MPALAARRRSGARTPAPGSAARRSGCRTPRRTRRAARPARGRSRGTVMVRDCIHYRSPPASFHTKLGMPCLNPAQHGAGAHDLDRVEPALARSRPGQTRRCARPRRRRRSGTPWCAASGCRWRASGCPRATRNRRLNSSLSRSMSVRRPTAPAIRSSADLRHDLDVPEPAGHRHDADRPAVRRGAAVALGVGGVRLVGVVEGGERPAGLGAGQHVAGPRAVTVTERLARPAMRPGSSPRRRTSSRAAARTCISLSRRLRSSR